MLNPVIKGKKAATSKCYFTHSILPTYVDQKQPPGKRKPFSTISSQPFNHTSEVLLPEQFQKPFQDELDRIVAPLVYSKVVMTLYDLIHGDFFQTYIKTGNVLMLSKGRASVDNIYSLCDGSILRLELDKPTYERCGLVGTPVQDGGRKHVKARYSIEINLQLPCMCSGRKGFERVIWAFKNVLNAPLVWLFYDYARTNDAKGPIEEFHPIWHDIKPQITRVTNTHVPISAFVSGTRDESESVEMQEWLGLAFLNSPRIIADDSIDSYLSRYQVPQFGSNEDTASCEGASNMIKLRWHGFIPQNYITQIFLSLRRIENMQWAAMQTAGFRGRGYMMLTAGSQNCYVWEGS